MTRTPIDLAARGIALGDGEERNRRYPDTFQIPPLKERESIPVGGYAKVLLLKEPQTDDRGERLWVEILEKLDYGYLGAIANDPVVFDLKDRELIVLMPKHVLSWLPPRLGNQKAGMA